MARPTSFEGTDAYRDQIATVRSIKDEIVGHVQRKETYIAQGLLHTLIEYLRNPRSPSKLNGKETRSHIPPQRKLSDTDVVLLQSLQVLNSLAIGGPPFLAPIYASEAIPVVLAHISPLDSHPQLSLTALRFLNNLADAATLADLNYATLLADALFAPLNLEILYSILASKSAHRMVQQQKCLVASLIGKLCKDTNHQSELANAGLLDALATLMVSFVIARGEVIPGAPELAQEQGLASWIPPAAPAGLEQHVILDAISAIVADSRFRAGMFLHSPALMAIFPVLEYHTPEKHVKNAWNTLERAGLATPTNYKARKAGAMEYLLPVVPRPLAANTAQFPPLGYAGPRDRISTGASSAKLSTWDSRLGLWDPASQLGADEPAEEEAEDSESPVVLWLTRFVRSSEPLGRVLAASLLASLFKAGFTRPGRDFVFGHAVVPALCEIIEHYSKENEPVNSAFTDPGVALNWSILERAPAVLARLVADCEYLQQAAYDCGIVKTVSKLLKHSYEPLSAQHAPQPWSTVPKRPVQHADSTRQIGQPGHLPIYIHRIKVRESSLKLIAAMSSSKDEFRKAFVEHEIVPYIVESLRPCPSKPQLTVGKPKTEKREVEPPALPTGEYSPYGNNPSSVIIAACHVLRILGRSISIVRTSLKDHGVAMPVFSLLKNADLEVQIAACAVMCNLVTEVSPMRDRLVEAGILKILCEHAHSLNPGLRLNSMWALKHLVDAVDNDLKKKALEELGSGWLFQLICDDTEDSALHERLMKSERRMSVDGDDEDMDQDLYEGGDNRTWSWPALYRTSNNHPLPSERLKKERFQRAEKKLLALREAEINPTRKARNDDLAIQEQGLNFIRNLIGPPSSAGGPENPNAQTEMVDVVFNELGQDRLFDILQGKLRPKVLHAFERRHPSLGREAKVLYPKAKVIEAVIYILVHMAASVPRHRQLVITQTELLRQLATQFSNGCITVRRALCHLLSNLVCVEDPDDAQASHQRAVELKRLGFQARLESLEHEDIELDVKEQARMAAFYMQQGHV